MAANPWRNQAIHARAHSFTALLAGLVVAVVSAPIDAAAELYRWTDREGVVRYTTDRERIPRRFRGAAQRVDASAVARPEASASPIPPLAVRRSTTPAPAPPARRDAFRVDDPVVEPSPAVPTEPASTPPPLPPVASADPRAEEIAELEREIAAKRERIKDLISQGRWTGGELAQDPELRELAEVLPRLQAELAALRSEVE